MATLTGIHSAPVALARDLLTTKGRREHGAFAFEGPTLLAEAWATGAPVTALYLTRAAYDGYSLAREIEAAGVTCYLVDDRAFAKLSDLEHPTGVLAVSPVSLEPIEALLRDPGLVLVLADLNDPGNAGTLLRSAEAFGVDRVIFGGRGAHPHHPKVVRAAMGSIFRQRLAVCSPSDLLGRGWTGVGLSIKGEPLERAFEAERSLLVVGHERHGLAAWEHLCGRKAAIPMAGPTESLNAAVAGSIALYEASKRRRVTT